MACAALGRCLRPNGVFLEWPHAPSVSPPLMVAPAGLLAERGAAGHPGTGRQNGSIHRHRRRPLPGVAALFAQRQTGPVCGGQVAAHCGPLGKGTHPVCPRCGGPRGGAACAGGGWHARRRAVVGFVGHALDTVGQPDPIQRALALHSGPQPRWPAGQTLAVGTRLQSPTRLCAGADARCAPPDARTGHGLSCSNRMDQKNAPETGAASAYCTCVRVLFGMESLAPAPAPAVACVPAAGLGRRSGVRSSVPASLSACAQLAANSRMADEK